MCLPTGILERAAPLAFGHRSDLGDDGWRMADDGQNDQDELGREEVNIFLLVKKLVGKLFIDLV